jgi:hypothetical protein
MAGGAIRNRQQGLVPLISVLGVDGDVSSSPKSDR